MITQEIIAKRARVSQTTASLVLSGRENASISDETRRRILDFAKKAGYRSRFQRASKARLQSVRAGFEHPKRALRNDEDETRQHSRNL